MATDRGFVWLVLGVTGEYSDRCEWVVAAHHTEETAAQHVELLKEYMAEKPDPDWEERRERAETNPYDRTCRIDYTGTEYLITKVPLVRHVDEYLEHHREG